MLLPGQMVSIHDAISQTNQFPPPPGYEVPAVVRRDPFQIPPGTNPMVDSLAAEELQRRHNILVKRELRLPAGSFPHEEFAQTMPFDHGYVGREIPSAAPMSGELMGMRFPDRQTSTQSGFRTMRTPKTQLELQGAQDDTTGWIYMNPIVTVRCIFHCDRYLTNMVGGVFGRHSQVFNCPGWLHFWQT